MSLVPVAIGLSSFAVGYVTSQYMAAPEGAAKEPSDGDKKDKKEKEKKTIPPSMADELKKFDKTKLSRVDAGSIMPYRMPNVIDEIREQLAHRRLFVKPVNKSDE